MSLNETSGFAARSLYLRSSVFWFSSSCVGETAARELAQWRCQKNVMRSTNGFGVRTMRSTHASTRSVSFPFGSSGLPSTAGSGPTSPPCGVFSSQSTAASRGWPIHAARSAALGPKPARQKRRSTMACDIAVGVNVVELAGGTCRR